MKYQAAYSLLKLMFTVAVVAMPTWPQQIASAVPSQVGANTAFVHQGLLHTQADLARMKTKVAAGASP